MRNASTALLAAVVLSLLSAAGWFGIANAASANPQARAVARAGNFVLADFPTGWSQHASKHNSTLAEQARSISQCKRLAGFDAKARKSSIDVPSAKFTQGDDEVSNSVTVYPADATAMNGMVILSDPSIPSCLQKVGQLALNQSLVTNSAAASSIKQVSVDVGEVRVAPVGDQTVAYRLSIAVATKVGITEHIYLDLQFVKVGRAVLFYSFQSTAQAGIDIVPTLIDVSQRRVQAALQGQPVPSPQALLALGQTAVGPKGTKITVFGYQPNVATQDVQPSAGHTFAAVDAQICAPPTPDQIEASPSNFALTFADNTQAQETFAGVQPEFSSSTISQGGCIRGLIGYEVPTGATPSAVLYQGLGSSLSLRWAVPGGPPASPTATTDPFAGRRDHNGTYCPNGVDMQGNCNGQGG